MPEIRILYAIDSLVRGGTELQLAGLIDRLDRRCCAPNLLTIRPSDPALSPANCPHLAWQVPRLLAPGGVHAVGELVRYLRRERIDVVQTFFQDSTVIAGLAARMAGVPVRLASFRDLGFWRTRAQEVLLHRIYPLMTGYLCNAEIVRDHVIRRDAIDPLKILVVRNGVDVESMPWAAPRDPVRRIGIVGNLTRRVKRTDLFLEAAARVMKILPEITYHVIGDGHLRGEFEDLARSLGIAESVVFTGRLDDVPGYLETLDVGVICSDSEGLSNALLEYMLKGVATVATAVGGNPELVVHDETGLLVPPGNAEALAAAMVRLAGASELRKFLSRNARRRIEQTFSWERCVADHTQVYARQLEAAGKR